MADATMERSLAAAIDSSVAATASTLIWLVPPQYQHYHHRFQEQEPPGYDDGHITGDVVAALLDEISPRDSDLDEWILERPTTQQMLLLAMASLQQDLDIMRIISQLEEAGEASYPNSGSAAVANQLGKQTFRAAGGGNDDGSVDHQSCGGITCACSICLEDFEDGEEIGVVPCWGRHEFHTNCITKWLGQYSNMCPLCRHALPTSVVSS
ncbi:hypothetical protein BAE44_0009522 [Dichanthelium oligosanthes]|uniref:RING-type E3 ubiquitin transferase n=1 Tax=Dichanthelium oligosanthes TaxID=888268 RepID=A0A1E5VWG2_9POAL|nr:hypothetical protein BAE44_0009522 [Dichanthelium oligosanthes]